MERLGIAIRDKAGVYAAAALIRRRPDLSFTVLYDPEGEASDFYESNRARFQSMNLSPCIYLGEDYRGDESFYSLLREVSGEGFTVGLKDSDFNTEFLYHTLGDGLFHHSYVLHMIDDYAERLSDEGTAILALLGYSYRSCDFARTFREKGISVVDPLDRWHNMIPEREEEGELRLYWTVRDYDLERLMSELIGETLRFRKYYSHPWLRGEVSKRQ